MCSVQCKTNECGLATNLFVLIISNMTIQHSITFRRYERWSPQKNEEYNHKSGCLHQTFCLKQGQVISNVSICFILRRILTIKLHSHRWSGSPGLSRFSQKCLLEANALDCNIYWLCQQQCLTATLFSHSAYIHQTIHKYKV